MSSDDEEDSSQPIYETPPPKYSAEYVIKLMLQPDEKKVCHEACQHNTKCNLCGQCR